MAKRFQDFRIVAKLATGFGAVLLLSAISSAFVFYQTHRQIEIARHNASLYKAVDMVDLMGGDLDAARSAMRKLVMTSRAGDHQDFETQMGTHDTHMAALTALLAKSAPDLVPLLDEYRRALDTYLQRILRSNANLALDPAKRMQAEDVVRSPLADTLSKAADDDLDRLRDKVDALSAFWQAEAESAAAHTQWMNAAAGVLTLLIGLGMALLIARAVAKPIADITTTVRSLARGELGVDVPGSDRGDEIGEMARGVQILKDAALEKRRLEEAAEAARRIAQDEQERSTAARAAAAAQQARVVDQLAGALNDLAAGNLVQRLDDPFAADYESLRADFNEAVARLQTTMQEVNATTGLIRNGAGEISSASDDLSRRTEQQAASLEETAAALAEITEDARKTAIGASHARDVVGAARGSADRSRQVIERTVSAMREIERSSRQVREILGVIDEIAFQTNLLALNAGVEAARAGESGRGFAVVASEVRSLAQRCAEAAKEIKTLIVASETQVKGGVQLVAETGECVTQIAAGVGEMNKVVEEIAGAAERQAVGLAEVNRAIDQMDQVTQKNAAMVEEATAATHGLAKESDDLVRLVGHFRVGANVATPVVAMPAPRRAVRQGGSPAVRLQNQVAAAVNDWTEF